MRAKKVDGREGRRTSLPHRFLRDRRGTTAIEFVILAIPFSLLVFAILESCVSFAAQQVLADTADRVARELRTARGRAAEAFATSRSSCFAGRSELLNSFA